jgi:hypothetical protein
MKAMTLQLPVEGAAADAEQTGGNGLVAPDLLQRPDDVFALDFDERCGGLIAGRLRRRMRCIGFAGWIVHTPLHRVERIVQAGVACHEHDFAVRPQVAKSPQHVEACDARPHQCQDGAVIVNNQEAGALWLHASG